MSQDHNNPSDPRARMMRQIAEGVGDPPSLDHTDKRVLARGCDPQMAVRATEMLPPHLGDPSFVSATSDDDFLERLQRERWSVIFFAPGACRYDAAGRPIPGGNAQTSGWTLAQYRDAVRVHQGDDIQIVETPDEREIIPLLRQALAQARSALPTSQPAT